MSDALAFDPAFGMVMLPPGNQRVSVSTWPDTRPHLAEFQWVERQKQIADDQPGEAWIDVVVALVPRPDNAYNSNAISVAQPASYGGTIDQRHLGFVFDKDLSLLGRPHATPRAAQMIASSDRPEEVSGERLSKYFGERAGP